MTNNRRRLTGHVVSNKMDKTVVVQVDRTYRHPLYGKVVSEFKRFMAHDEQNECDIGDMVVIVESRPISRHKRWVVQDILREDISARMVEVAAVAEIPLQEEEEAEVEEAVGEETQLDETPTEALEPATAADDSQEEDS
jgi:small subunit ribosomal protein S17